jgi:ABC-type glycerol-3-phosphate transport system substrate-binding protein
VPWIDNAQAMIFINLDLFETAGVDPAKWNESYDPMTDAARKVQALGGDVTAS